MCLLWEKKEEGERVREFKENEKGEEERKGRINLIKSYGAKVAVRFFRTTENKNPKDL